MNGGATGQKSIFNGLKAVVERHSEKDIIVVHDGNRPMVSQEIITDNLAKQKQYSSAVATIPCVEVLFVSENKTDSDKSIPMETVQRTQTPQSYRLGDLWDAHLRANERGIKNTSASCSLMEALGKTDEVTTVKEMAELYARAGNVALVKTEAAAEDRGTFNPMDNSSLNSDKIKAIGYRNIFSVEEGVFHTVSILKEILV